MSVASFQLRVTLVAVLPSDLTLAGAAGACVSNPPLLLEAPCEGSLALSPPLPPPPQPSSRMASSRAMLVFFMVVIGPIP